MPENERLATEARSNTSNFPGYAVFDKTAYKLPKIQYSVESLYFSP
jgi:hypothetical protein